MPELEDFLGVPLKAGQFVRVKGPGLTRRRPCAYSGVVDGFAGDAYGPVVFVKEWRFGRFTGRRRTARPEMVMVDRPPNSNAWRRRRGRNPEEPRKRRTRQPRRPRDA